MHLNLTCICQIILGKSLICKEKALQTAEKQNSNPNPGPVFFISLVGVNELGIVDDYEHIFDIYTKLYDFVGSDVKIVSAQDLWSFYQSKHPGADRRKTNVYVLAEFFVSEHPTGHFVFDECSFQRDKISKTKII